MRMLIFSLLILMVAIPPLLGAPPFYLQGPPSPNAERWLDFTRTFLATLTGAGIAFLANLYLQERARRAQNLAAGHYAMAVLTRQYDGFVNIRRSIHGEVVRCRERAPDTPLWLSLRPVVHALPEDLEFDFHSLAFLFQGNSDLEFFGDLHLAESKHREIIRLLERHADMSTERQKRFETAGFVNEGAPLRPKEVEAAVGPRIMMELVGLVQEILHHCERDGAIYERASDTFQRGMVAHFGADYVPLKLTEREA